MQALLPTKRLVHTLIDPLLGILIAGLVIILWVTTLLFFFSINVAQIPWLWTISAVLLRTFLHTGIFITAHDAMHGTVFPQNHRINDFIGSLASRMYVLLPYKTLLEKHRLHHRYPATENDPDFCGQGQKNPFVWYIKFMKGYLEGKQSWVLLIGMSIIFYGLLLGLNIPISNLILFWLLPLLLSSIQLFYFGVFLPHRRPSGGYRNRHRAQSSYYSIVGSFIACYHFGYHWEHHEYPYLPWYKLPSVVTKLEA
ncbi:MAG TPA: fatty acid desaturase [Coleofasciculaceae cyanobacterium]|jgi:beta-carotene ketolase (CrtW type)